METFGDSKREWRGQFLELSNGTPSDDTFRRVISRLDSTTFEKRFREWTAAVAGRNEQEKMPAGTGPFSEADLEANVIALDGKTLRGSVDRNRSTLSREGTSKAPLHLVSAWASDKRLVLAQEPVEEKTNQISALPEVLKALDLSGSVVTIDAIGTQKAIARRI